MLKAKTDRLKITFNDDSFETLSEEFISPYDVKFGPIPEGVILIRRKGKVYPISSKKLESLLKDCDNIFLEEDYED